MSGSKRYFRYQADAGDSFAVELDEGNSEGNLGGATLMLQRGLATLNPLPKGLEMRYVIAQTTLPADLGSKIVKRKFYIGNPAAILQTTSGSVLSAQAYPGYGPSPWTVTYYGGEKRRIIPQLNTVAGDTGLDDGDQGLDQPL